MQEQVNEKTVALSTRSARMTAHVLEKMIRAYLQHRRNIKNKKGIKPHKTGQKSIKTLTRDGSSIADVEISGDNIGSFKKIARKYNIDFALKKVVDSKSEQNLPAQAPRWVVFFKSKDDRAIDSAFREYSKISLAQKPRKSSLLTRISKFKEVVKLQPEPVKNHKRGGHEL